VRRGVFILVIAAFLAAPMLGTAQQAQPNYRSGGAGGVPPIEQVTPPPVPIEPPQQAVKQAKSVTVTGMVEAVKSKKGKVAGYALKTDSETYMLKGKKVSAMVGKKVEATGTVATAAGGKKTLTVKQVKEVM
jgi:hypothetical protein